MHAQPAGWWSAVQGAACAAQVRGLGNDVKGAHALHLAAAALHARDACGSAAGIRARRARIARPPLPARRHSRLRPAGSRPACGDRQGLQRLGRGLRIPPGEHCRLPARCRCAGSCGCCSGCNGFKVGGRRARVAPLPAAAANHLRHPLPHVGHGKPGTTGRRTRTMAHMAPAERRGSCSWDKYPPLRRSCCAPVQRVWKHRRDQRRGVMQGAANQRRCEQSWDAAGVPAAGAGAHPHQYFWLSSRNCTSTAGTRRPDSALFTRPMKTSPGVSMLQGADQHKPVNSSHFAIQSAQAEEAGGSVQGPSVQGQRSQQNRNIGRDAAMQAGREHCCHHKHSTDNDQVTVMRSARSATTTAASPAPCMLLPRHQCNANARSQEHRSRHLYVAVQDVGILERPLAATWRSATTARRCCSTPALRRVRSSSSRGRGYAALAAAASGTGGLIRLWW